MPAANTSNKSPTWYVGLRLFACLAFCICLTLFFLRTLPSLRIETDLIALLPSNQTQQNLQAVEERMTAANEDQFILAITHQNEDTLVQAANNIKQKLAASPIVDVLEPAGSMGADQDTDILRQHRFHLLSPPQRDRLNTNTPEQLYQDAQRKLYSLTSGLTLTQIESDPLGLFDEWLLGFSAPNSNIQFDDHFMIVETEEGDLFYLLQGKLTSTSLSLDTQTEFAELIKGIEADLFNLHSEPPNLFKSGVIFHAMSAANAAKKEVALISGVSVISIIALMLIVFRSLKPLLFAVTAIGAGCFVAFTLVHFVFGQIHLITLVFGASLIGVAVDYCFHYFTHANQESTNNLSTLNTLFPGLSLSLTTSLVGYGCLFFSTMPGLQQIALFSVVGLASSWLFVVCVFPFFKFNSSQSVLPLQGGAQLSAHFSNTLSSPTKILCLGLVLTATVIAASQWLRFEDEPRALYKPDEELVANDQTVQSLLPNFSPTQFLAVMGDSSESVLQNEETITTKLNTLIDEQAISRYLMTSQFVPSEQKQTENYDLQASVIYGTDNIAERFQRELGISEETIAQLHNDFAESAANYVKPTDLLESDLLQRVWMGNINNQYVSLILLENIQNPSALESLSQEFENLYFIDRVKAIETSLSSQRQQAMLFLLIAYITISAVLLLRYRQFQAILVILIPFSASAVAISLLIATGAGITLFHVFALFLVLGLGLDYGIFLKETGNTNGPTLLAILLSTITTCLGFGMLAFSSTPMVSAFGIVMIAGGLSNGLLSPFIMSLTHKPVSFK